MDTKKTIIVSVLTTLATIFVVAVIMHMCCGNCGKRSHCSSAPTHCSAANSHCEGGSYAKCSKGASCSKKAMCTKGENCKGKSSCSKASCDKSKCEKGTKMMEWTSEDGDKVVKKVIKVDVEEEK